MNKIIISTILCSVAGSLACSAQVLGSYQFYGADQTAGGGLQTNPALAESLKATYVASKCIDLSAITPSGAKGGNPRNWSTNTYDSSLTSGPKSNGGTGISGNHADCFGGWGKTYSSSKLVEFKLTFNSSAVGQINDVNLKIGSYGYYNDPSRFKFNVLKNGSSVYSTTRSITSKWVTQSFDLSGLSLNSGAGSTDVYTFQLGAYGNKVNDKSVIGLDNININGKHQCVPEPSTTSLFGLGVIATLLRRRR